MHAVPDGHEIAKRYGDFAASLEASGTFWKDHALPFHPRASGSVTVFDVYHPTASQCEAVAHASPMRSAPADRAAREPVVGTGTRLHEAPFHLAASGSERPLSVSKPPTARHDVAELHETALNHDESPSFGARRTVQALP